MWKEFVKFIRRGNVVDLAVGIILGTAFNAIVRSMVDDMLMPPLGLAVGNVDFSDLYITLRDGTPGPPYENIAAAKEAGAVILRYGQFLQTIFSFLILAGAVFFLVRGVAKLMPPPAPPASQTKDCPYCISAIPLKAQRCPHCTSSL